MNIKQDISQEIVQLHQFFQDWFNGILPATQESFARFADVLHPEFSIIPPNGQIIPREYLLTNLWNAHAARTKMRIWIENSQVRAITEETYLATYEEWQEIDECVSNRQSSALFYIMGSTPNGVRWLHVHETWITPVKRMLQ